MYELTVRASDGTMYADRMVRVTVTDANDAPMIMGKDSVDFAENGEDPVATFTATDPEGAMSITWSVPTAADPDDTDGPLSTDDHTDRADFTIDEDGMLKFSSPPDYEAGTGGGGDADNDNTYHVVVAAADAATGGETGYHKVTVKVTDVVETGKVTWTTNANADNTADDPTLVQFQVGSLLTATATDDDISGADKNVTAAGHQLTWKWYRGGTQISGSDAEDNTYTVTTTDVGSRLRATAFYNVGEAGREESASLTSDYPVLGSRTNNEEPEFDPATITREVSEGKKGMTVGAPVRATDDITNALNYTLTGGADQTKFEIDQKTGQITTMVDLDFDSAAGAGDNCEALNSCVVQVTATDSAGSVSDPVATVTIKITDVNEKPTFDDATGNPTSITIPENSMALFGTTDDGYSIDADTGVTYTAMDPEELECLTCTA